jgi:acyl-CoA thioester hydrolase
MNQIKQLVLELAFPIRWVDMDAFGHVNTSVYFTYFEQTRIEWLMSIAPANYLSSTASTGPVVINASCTFLKSIIYPETIVVKLFAGPPGRSSFETYYEICSQGDPSIRYAEGSAKIVWVDRMAECSMPLPKELLKFLPESVDVK